MHPRGRAAEKRAPVWDSALDRVSQRRPEPCEYNKPPPAMQAGGGFAGRRVTLLFYLIGNIVERVADLAAGLSEPFLHVTGGLVRDPFVVHPLVIRYVSPRLLGAALHLVGLAVELVTIHAVPPAQDAFKFRCVSHKGLRAHGSGLMGLMALSPEP